MHETLPDPLLARGPDEVAHVRLREVLIVVLDELGVNGGDGHEDVDRRSRGAQQHVPHLGGDRQKQWRVRELLTDWKRHEDSYECFVEGLVSFARPTANQQTSWILDQMNSVDLQRPVVFVHFRYSGITKLFYYLKKKKKLENERTCYTTGNYYVITCSLQQSITIW